jgi:hypothetical protein
MLMWSSTFFLVICQTVAFAFCENYSPPEGFKEKDLYHLLEKVGTPSGADGLGKSMLGLRRVELRRNQRKEKEESWQ